MIRARDTVVKRYRAGESVNAIAQDYRVAWDWLGDCLTAWGVPLRTRAEAMTAWHARQRQLTNRTTQHHP
ncbi:hypothetical protein GCM10010387_00140 [Streptomyces inusitatus]|uniref:Uncharacterized protein n=1 Tax=Streptomyces inusitatus TaxID=68221 RepID=A0A918UIG7_9ACTN|nr:hypothetical protein [Streptomyces inusitatus]GGZ12270.1 hypothetical protein GCM10010387_00140 [Streptomyces inusitatus]